MEKCRICLGNKKNLMSIFENDYECVSFAVMIQSISNVKVDNDSITTRICRSCRKTLRDAYDFKLLIERSNDALTENSNIKRISFTNFKDIKIKIEIDTDIKYSVPNHIDMSEFFKDGVNEISYHNTIIKKKRNGDIDMTGGPIPVIDFLNSLKEEPYEDDCNDDNYEGYHSAADSDEEYNIAPYPLRKIDKSKGNKVKKKAVTKKEKFKNKKKVENICIRPIFLRDVRMLPNKRKERTQEEKREALKRHNENKKPRVCPHCGIMTKSLKTHLLVHTGERKFKCDHCCKAYFNKANLVSHMKRHSEIRDHKCDQCIAAFTGKADLKSHMLTHSTEKNFICDTCSKGFKRKNALHRHRLMHNSANKTVMCELCNMSFFSKFGLNHHMRVHTGERPYNCEICSQPYSYKHDFNRHCLKKHGVFFKRRSVYVMNEEVLQQERILMKELMLRVNGVVQDGKPLNPFEGPQGVQAFEMAVKALKSRQIPIDFHL